MSKQILIPRDQVSQYLTQCPKCDKQHIALVANRSGFVPPPAVGGACQCHIPVVPITMIYQGQIRQAEDFPQ